MRTLLLALVFACAGGHRADAPDAVGAPGSAVDPAPRAADAPAARTDVKAPGNLPVRTESELAAESEARDTCIQSCVQQRQMEARAIEMIEADCQASCLREHPIEQVEVVPDLAPAPLSGG